MGRKLTKEGADLVSFCHCDEISAEDNSKGLFWLMGFKVLVYGVSCLH